MPYRSIGQNIITITIMKSTVKKATVNTMSAVATIAKNVINIIASETNGGKPCLSLITDLRLSTDDFKSLMGDIQQAGGYGFMKYLPEYKGRFITVTKIDRETLSELANGYSWSVAEPKTKTPAKAIKTKTDKAAKQQATSDISAEIDPATFKAFQEFQAMLKAASIK